MPKGNSTFGFAIGDLNQLALCEQRVIAAGLDAELVERLDEQSDGDDDASYRCFSTAEQRARALLALLDAHPELEAK